MMLGETHRHPDPTVLVPSWPYFDDDLTANNHLQEALAELPCYLPSDEPDFDSDSEIDAYSCDHFRMFELKVRLCRRPRPHDWTECPYAHPGEKARRRDPRKFHYSGTGCSDFRKGNCRKGESCQFAHGVFESWLHPARYRTLPCKDGSGCRRRVCFFAHTPDQLRVVSPPAEPSPPVSPMAQSPSGSIFMTSSINSMVASLRNLQLVKVKSLPSSRFGSPRGVVIRPGFCSLPSTPTQNVIRPGYLGLLDDECEEEPVMERVESGRHLRSKMFEKLGKENSLERDKSGQCHGGPNVDWVSDLVN